MLAVGPFTTRSTATVGGTLTSGQLLIDSSFFRRFDLTTIDTTQRRVPAPALGVRAVFAIGRTIRFVRALETRSPAAVLLFAAIGASVVEKSACAWYARLRGVPSLLFLRGGAFMDRCHRSRAYRRLAQSMVGGADVLLCQSETWQRFFVETLGVAVDRCPIVPNWTATPELLAAGQARISAPRIHSGPVTLLYMGWVHRQKGIIDLLEAVRRLGSAADWNLVVAGEGTDAAAARAFVKNNGLADRVNFLGWVRGDRRLEVLNRADVFVLPSHAEGVSNAVIEAMSAALPVVVTAVGGMPDIVQEGVTGRLVPAADPAALARALQDVMRDREAIVRMGAAAHAFAARTFAVESSITRLGDVIAGIAARSATLVPDDRTAGEPVGASHGIDSMNGGSVSRGRM